MLDTILLAIAVIVTFAGCAILFVDVVATKKTDFCQEETPARYVGKGSDDQTESNRRSGLFVLAVPEFRYEFEGRTYQGKSANVFFHLYLGRKQLPVPFLDGKTYLIYVNPAQPAMYVTSGEQRFAFMHLLGCSVSVVGIMLLLFAMGIFG
ncbi:hypothetical protein [Raoultibacter massiliensis]|uniref:DUF3592 domain-containing protein n=1 Tax=Raoultibacter massiliensis TaxID=1852371 RepID=A0ABV1JCK4_9ACTN|nr:hypothetical protein [Raoultibacter massiliensis]